MSLELYDCGKLKLPQDVHSELLAEAQADGIDLIAVVRRILQAHTRRAASISTLTQKIHHRKGLGEISGD